MAFRTRKRKRLDPAQLRLPLVALIDVVLFLLMYFMVAGTLGAEEKEIAAALTVDKGGAQRSAMLPTILTLAREGPENLLVFRLGERSFTSQAALSEFLTSLPKDAGMVIKASNNTTVADIAAAMQAGRGAGFTRLSFVGK